MFLAVTPRELITPTALSKVNMQHCEATPQNCKYESLMNAIPEHLVIKHTRYTHISLKSINRSIIQLLSNVTEYISWLDVFTVIYCK